MPTDTARPRRSILVAEDETLLRMLAVDMLEDAGFQVIEVASGDAGAKALAEGGDIAALLTDIQMPGDIDGIALARITHDLHPDAAILVVSGQRLPAAAALPEGAKFMAKPYEVKKILSALNELLPPRA